MNHAAIDRGVTDAVKVEIPAEWKNAVDETVQEAAEGRKEVVDYVNNILTPVNAQRGDSLPVSAFVGLEDGTMPQGTAAYENVVLLLMFRNGCLKIVFNVTSVHMYALTLSFVLYQ